MSWAEVASSRASGGASAGATTVAATFGASVAVGDLLWAAVVYESGAGGNITGVAGDGTWVQVGAEVQIPGPDVWLSLWKHVAVNAGEHTVTCTFNVSRNLRGIFIGAFTGNVAAGTVNTSDGDYDASTSAPSVSITTTVDGCLLLGVSINNNGVGATAGSGYSTVVTGGGPDYPIAFEWKEQSTQGATVVDYTALSGTPSFAIHGAAFEPATGGGPVALEGVGRQPAASGHGDLYLRPPPDPFMTTLFRAA